MGSAVSISDDDFPKTEAEALEKGYTALEIEEWKKGKREKEEEELRDHVSKISEISEKVEVFRVVELLQRLVFIGTLDQDSGGKLEMSYHFFKTSSCEKDCDALSACRSELGWSSTKSTILTGECKIPEWNLNVSILAGVDVHCGRARLLIFSPEQKEMGSIVCCLESKARLLAGGSGGISVVSTQYYTAVEYHPVQSIGIASVSGHATNVIEGTSVGMESTAIPCFTLAVAVLSAFYSGEASGLTDVDGNAIGGLFGSAVATMGMLSTAVYILAMDFFGPISDNAGGIVELADEPERVRQITDELDAVGNTTKAATKGYAVSSALMACFLLFSAFNDEVRALIGSNQLSEDGIDLAKPEILMAGLLGSMLVFLFSAWTIRAVGSTAQMVVKEVKLQWTQNPDILTGRAKPKYKRCVAILTQSALKEMIKPGMLACVFPLLTGIGFRILGEYRGDQLLGAKSASAVLMFATTTGVILSLYLNNAGGAWDNAKKLIETGVNGGKGSDAHKAAVTGDTVGDPFKDAAGPSIHVLIKLLSTITLVVCPLFVPNPTRG
eukprot:g4489.t1